MSAFKKDIVIHNFPAYKVFTREKRSGTDAIDVTHGDILGLRKEHRGDCYYRHYTVCSVMTCCSERNECPIEGYNRAIELGHEVYWLSQNSVGISDHKQAQGKIIQIEVGDKVNFLGKKFEIYAQANDNLGLREIDDKAGVPDAPVGVWANEENTLSQWADIIVKD